MYTLGEQVPYKDSLTPLQLEFAEVIEQHVPEAPVTLWTPDMRHLRERSIALPVKPAIVPVDALQLRSYDEYLDDTKGNYSQYTGRLIVARIFSEVGKVNTGTNQLYSLQLHSVDGFALDHSDNDTHYEPIKLDDVDAAPYVHGIVQLLEDQDKP